MIIAPRVTALLAALNLYVLATDQDPGCWRALIWRKLQAANVTNTKFVGTQPAQGCGFIYDGANEGHGGGLATAIVSNNQLPR
ncbi:hypothetical protein NKR23_g8438 [Pleurostoma richardsiae]|uniref:Uncharacterized protein n=1 Tax=Pleurostoma richardsiae TaxID=41990 RepID=A0AA38RQE4_9PEZI|nr:hypothetical protein NKR23_g8438 [Pleurostoma richardsiae]